MSLSLVKHENLHISRSQTVDNEDLIGDLICIFSILVPTRMGMFSKRLLIMFYDLPFCRC